MIEANFEIAFAKINLALHVRGRRPDGYHELETIFAFLDDGDRLSAEISDQFNLTISGPFKDSLLENDDNLVLKAARLLRAHFKIEHGAAITLDKRLPVASGIGGGSADAAAAARLLNRLWKIDASERQLAELLAPLGADVPACIYSNTQIGTGTGTALLPVQDNGLRGAAALLVNPNIALATGPVFSGWDGQDKGGLTGRLLSELVTSGRNDLQQPAIAQCSEIADILAALESYDPEIARMSGSGATCFAIFPNKDKCLSAKLDIQSTFPQWWTMAGKLR